MVFLFIVHEGSDGAGLVGAVAGLAMNTDGSLSNPKLVNRAWDDVRRSSMVIRRHE